MIKVLPGDVYYSSQSIIFNPVSIADIKGGFLNKVKIMYPFVYQAYKETLLDQNANNLLGDIQLVYVGSNQFLMNGYCINKEGSIDKFALCKTLVELCNLAYEYNISVGLEYGLGRKDQERDDINLIIKTVFDDIELDVKLFDRSIGDQQ